MTKKVLTDQQKKFLEVLFIECDGNFSQATKLAGYHPGSVTHVVNSLKEEIIELAQNILVRDAVKAASTLTKMLDAGEAVAPGSMLRVTAAKEILDRIGVSKREQVDVNMTSPSSVFILPAKKEIFNEG